MGQHWKVGPLAQGCQDREMSSSSWLPRVCLLFKDLQALGLRVQAWVSLCPGGCSPGPWCTNILDGSPAERSPALAPTGTRIVSHSGSHNLGTCPGPFPMTTPSPQAAVVTVCYSKFLDINQVPAESEPEDWGIWKLTSIPTWGPPCLSPVLPLPFFALLSPLPGVQEGQRTRITGLPVLS